MRPTSPIPTSVRWALAAVATVVVVGCASLAQPTAIDAAWAAEQWPEVTQAELQRGRALYVKRCAGCHALRLPERFPTSAWQQHVDEMAKRAHLLPAEREPMLRYLVTMSRPGAGAKEAPSPPG